MAVESAVQSSLEVPQTTKKRWHLSRNGRKAFWFYFFQSPWLFGIIFLTVIPIVGGLIISMTNYDGINLATAKFLGLKNYLRMFDDKQGIQAFMRTLVFVSINVPLGMFLSFSLALILNQAVRGRGVFRTVYYLPTLVPIIAVAWIFKLFLASKNGPLNGFIGLFRPGTEIVWIGQANALATVTSMALWMTFGTGMVIFLAGLQGIPPELEEAAVVDGANRLQVFRNVTIPLMTPVIFFQLVLALINTFQELLRPILLWSTGRMEGTPSKPVYLMMIHVYREIFTMGRFGYGAAVLWFNFIVMMGLALFVFWTQKYWVYYTEAVEEKERMTAEPMTVAGRRAPRWRKIFNTALSYVLLLGIAVFVLLPIVWGLDTSLKQEGEYSANPIKWLPRVPYWINYVHVFTYAEFLKHARNSLFLAVMFSVLTVITSSMSGFAFSRIQVPGREKLFRIVIALIIIPYLVTVIPQFMLFARLKLTNTYYPWLLWGLAASPFHIFLFRQFFSAIPRELEDAAEVDGANPFRIFWQIFLPNAKPALATSFILNFIWVWGDYLTPILYLNDRITTLAVKLQSAYSDPHGNTLVTVVIAASVLYTLPLILMFFLAQKHILQGVVTSGLKG